MTKQPPTTQREGTSNHPAAALDTIVVDPDSVVETMKRNHRERHQQRTHVLRVTPLFEGERTASMHVSQSGNYYPPEMTHQPLHIAPAAFVGGHSRAKRREEWKAHLNHPTRSEARRLFREEHGLYDDETGDALPIADDDEWQEEWQEWWKVTVETWESHVRREMETTDEVVLAKQHPDTEDTTVNIRFEPTTG